MAGLKRDCSLTGKINVLHTLEVGSSPAYSILIKNIFFVDSIKVLHVLAKFEMGVQFPLYG